MNEEECRALLAVDGYQLHIDRDHDGRIWRMLTHRPGNNYSTAHPIRNMHSFVPEAGFQDVIDYHFGGGA